MRVSCSAIALTLAASLALTPVVQAESLARITNQDAVAGLRDALAQGAAQAVALLGKQDGFLGNAQVKIPLPESLQRIEGLMRGMGMGHYADELVTRMNRAAEAAVPEARALLVDSVKKMSVQDAKGILSGPEDSATQYFKRTTSAQLTQRFLPIIKRATAGVKLAEQYNAFAGQAANFGLMSAEDADLDRYVTRKALDGLFLMIAAEEKSIRDNPMAAVTSVAKRVFGALGR
jgi:hypothetical protein